MSSRSRASSCPTPRVCRLSAGGRWIRTIGTAYRYRVRVLLGLREVRSSRGDIASQDATSECGRSRLRSLGFALRERRLAAHDALDGLTSRTLRGLARDTAVRSLLSRPFPAA